jgi:hypothetical protein
LVGFIEVPLKSKRPFAHFLLWVCHGLTGLDRVAFTSALSKPIP